MRKKTIVAGLAGALALAGCAGGGGTTDPTEVDGEIEPREISWLLSRPADGAVIQVIEEIAAEYGEEHPGFSLELITTPDRPSYLQRLETLAAANELPELFDTDATPYAQQLAEQGRMVDVEQLLEELGLLDDFRPMALDYQRFDDGSLYLLPFEFEPELFWYNAALLEEAGVEVPETLDDLPALCGPLRENDTIPIAVGGQDGWPLQRYLAYQPFRLEGPGFIESLRRGEASMSEGTGLVAAEWMAELGENECFAEGFSSHGYTDARDLFTTGQAAFYQMGTWELATLASEDLEPEVRDNIGYFRLPTVDGAVTAENEYTVVSGIGAAISAESFDPLVKDFVSYLLQEYPERFVESGHHSPIEGYEPVIPEGVTPLYEEALAEVEDLGESVAVPWDTQLDPTTNDRVQQDLVLLVQGEISPEDFAETVDASIAENAPRYFGD